MRAVVAVTLLVALVVLPTLAAGDAASVVTITSPKPGITITSESVQIAATYTAAEQAAIKEVALLVDGNLVEAREVYPPEASGSVSFTWLASRYLEGKHRLGLRVTDTLGQTAVGAIGVLLKRDQSSASAAIRISSPLTGSTVSGPVRVEVAGEQPELVKYVIFLVDDVFKAITNLRPFSYIWDSTQYLNGLHHLQVKAYLAAGGESLSPVVEVRVDNPGGATAMRGASPAPAAPASEPSPYPARAATPALPPPMRTESPSGEGVTLEVAEPEVAVPGSAPFISPTGDLVIPEPPAVSAPAEASPPVEVAALPSAALEQPTLPPPALATVAEPSAAPPAAAVPGPSSLPAPATTEGVLIQPRPSALGMQLAMLPPKPAEPQPAPRVIAAPTPPPSAETVYVVQEGDCLWSIAAAHQVSPVRLAEFNDLANPNLIQAGQRLRLPTATLYCNGKPLPAAEPELTAEGRAIVPFRAVVEEAGGAVTWEAATREAGAVAGDHAISVTIGSQLAEVDGATKDMGFAAALRANRTMVPLRFLGEALDLILQYQDGIIHIASAR